MAASKPSPITEKLSRVSPKVFSAYCIVAAFTTYFCMYGFRKPFTAGTYEGTVLLGVGYKTILVAAQVFGYTISKFIGIKVVSEMSAHRRAISILILIGIAEAALLLFAITPPPYNFIWLFVNGLPLGMVFGLVLGFLEGRRVTEALAAGLCASFIVSSGVVKSVGRYLIEWGVSEYWMPFLTGLVFVVPLLIAVWLLEQIPHPCEEDVAHRSRREPMRRPERIAFFKRHAVGLTALLGIYVLLTVMRSIRDDFAVEIWRDLGEDGKPAIFAQSELLVMLGVVVITGAAIYIRSNRRAFLSSLGLVCFGAGMVLLAIYGHWDGWLEPFPFMVLLGFGMYVPYVVFHTMVFERMLAAFREIGTIGYLMYLADALGYLGYVAIMVLRQWISEDVNFLNLMIGSGLIISVVALAISLFLVIYYSRHLPADRPAGDPPTV